MDSKANHQMVKEMNSIELIIGKIMRIGVIISAIIMIIGYLLLIVTGKSGYPSHVIPTSFHQIIGGVLTLKPYAIMMLGIFCLILTPVLRVVVSIYSFYKEHDRLYVYITSLVLVILICSFMIGILK